MSKRRRKKSGGCGTLLILIILAAFAFAAFKMGLLDSILHRDSDASITEIAQDLVSDVAEKVSGETKPEIVVEHSFADDYAYATLSDEERTVYDEIMFAIEEYQTDLELSTKDLDLIERVFNAVTADHGEYFWIDGYSYMTYTRGSDSSDIIKVKFTPQFRMTQGEQQENMIEVKKAAAVYLEQAKTLGSDYEKALYLFERLITDVDYVEGAPENQNILSVFLYGETVCSGYANAYQYLLSELGIQSAVIKGTAKGGPHAWNLVLLDGDYYFIDVTWGNSSYSMGESAGMHYYINYGYFGVTSEEIGRTHVDDGSVALANCTAQTNNYYVKNDLYFTSADSAAIGAAISNAYNRGAGSMSVKLADNEIYNFTKEYFIDNQHIVDVCPGLTSISYIMDEDLCILYFDF